MGFTIAGHRIGPGEPCFIIAEAGVNHENQASNAKFLVDDAIGSGCDAIKFQTYQADKLAAVDSPLYWNGSEKSQREVFAKSDKLSRADFAGVMDYARERGIVAFSTPFDFDAVDFLETLNVPLYKVASADITYHDLLRKMARTGKPILLSTGASEMDEIERALEVIGETSPTPPVVLLACTLCYPTKDEDANLRQIEALAELGHPVGLSDHTESTVLPSVAVALGACVVEKHFTFDRGFRNGVPDHKMSMDPLMMTYMVNSIRSTERALGVAEKVVLGCEREARRNARRSVAAVVEIPEGGVLKSEMLTCLRPGGGIAPEDLDALIGHRAVRRIFAGTIIREGDIEGSTSDTRNWESNWVLILDGMPIKPKPVRATVRYEIGHF